MKLCINTQKIPMADRFLKQFLKHGLTALILGGSWILASSVHAQSRSEQVTLTLDQAVQRTLEQHPQLGVFQHRREAYQGLVDQAGVGHRPDIGLMLEDFGGTGDHQAFDNAQSTLSISWVTQAARIDGRIQAAQIAAGQVDAQQEIKALDLSAQTARLFIQALVEEHRFTLAQQAVEQARNTVALITERVDAGRTPEFERLQAEVELAQRELEVEDLQHMLSATRYLLSAQWGGEGDDIVLVGELYKIPALASVDQQFEQLKQNPALALFATQQRIAESEIELARIESRPQLQFSAGVRRFEATDDFGLVAGVSLPFGKDRSLDGKIRSLRAKQGEYQSESKALQLRLSTQLYVLLLEIKHSQHVIETLQQRVIPALDRALAETARAYESGKLGYLQWTSILNKKLGAEQDLLSAFEAIHLQHIEMQRLSGTTLTFQER